MTEEHAGCVCEFCGACVCFGNKLTVDIQAGLFADLEGYCNSGILKKVETVCNHRSCVRMKLDFKIVIVHSAEKREIVARAVDEGVEAGCKGNDIVKMHFNSEFFAAHNGIDCVGQVNSNGIKVITAVFEEAGSGVGHIDDIIAVAGIVGPSCFTVGNL